MVFIRPLEGHIVLSVGTRHELNCIATGQPAPEYVWLKDGVVINEADGFKLTNSSR